MGKAEGRVNGVYMKYSLITLELRITVGTSGLQQCFQVGCPY